MGLDFKAAAPVSDKHRLPPPLVTRRGKESTLRLRDPTTTPLLSTSRCQTHPGGLRPRIKAAWLFDFSETPSERPNQRGSPWTERGGEPTGLHGPRRISDCQRAQSPRLWTARRKAKAEALPPQASQVGSSDGAGFAWFCYSHILESTRS